MKEFEKNLKNMFQNLPEFEPKEETWQKIENSLEFSEKLNVLSHDLPEFNPSESLWNKIEQKLKIGNIRHIHVGWIKVAAAAASVAIIVTSWYLFKNTNNETVTITEETVAESQEKIVANSDSVLLKANSFINEQCKAKIYICEDPVFSEKKQRLEQLNLKIEELDNIIKTSGNSTSLIKARLKLEKTRTMLVKELINKIVS